MHPSELDLAAFQPLAGQLDDVVAMMRTISRTTKPEAFFREYVERIRQFYAVDRVLLLKHSPDNEHEVIVTEVTEWTRPRQLYEDDGVGIHLQTGLLLSLLEQGEPLILNDWEYDEDDPGTVLLAGMRSLRAVPLFENGETAQMIIGLKAEPEAFRPEELPGLVWLSNLFRHALQNLSLAEQLKSAYQSVDREMKSVGEIQRSLLPESYPDVYGLELSSYYETSQRAGGDYYDFFPLPDGNVGILIADVSGHGTPAAVVMAIMHTIAHTFRGPYDSPGVFLNYLNEHITDRYTNNSGTFVTAFYGVYNPHTGNFKYASAGHNPPLRRRCGATTVTKINKVGGMPLGVTRDIQYEEAEELLYPGDRVVLYTDGIVEAAAPDGELFGTGRLGEMIGNCDLTTSNIVDSVVAAVNKHTRTTAQSDDRTLVVMILRNGGAPVQLQ